MKARNLSPTADGDREGRRALTASSLLVARRRGFISRQPFATGSMFLYRQIWIVCCAPVQCLLTRLELGRLRVGAGHQEIAVEVAHRDFHVFATGKVTGTNREVEIVVAASFAARAVASNRSMKISASIAVPPWFEGLPLMLCRATLGFGFITFSSHELGDARG